MSKEVQLQLVENIKTNYDCNIIINETEPYVLFQANQIGKILGMKNINKQIKDWNINDKVLQKASTSGGPQIVCYLTYNGFMKVLSKTRKTELFDFTNKINIDVNTYIYACIEADTIKCILCAFKTETMIEQYNVNSYRIDLYFPEYKLAVECDELHHQTNKNNIKDKQREEEIKKLINCTFIRYNPFDKNFNIFVLINQIYKFISLQTKQNK